LSDGPRKCKAFFE